MEGGVQLISRRTSRSESRILKDFITRSLIATGAVHMHVYMFRIMGPKSMGIGFQSQNGIPTMGDEIPECER